MLQNSFSFFVKEVIQADLHPKKHVILFINKEFALPPQKSYLFLQALRNVLGQECLIKLLVKSGKFKLQDTIFEQPDC